MGNSGEEGKNAKNEKSPPSPAMNNCHVYPDWAAVQAFYGPRLAMPPYSISPVTPSPTNPHYIWAPPQSMIAHYGAPYPAFYAPYAHPGVPVVTPTMESPAKSIGNSGAVLKKHKEIDGLAISIGNGSVDDNDTPTEGRRSSDSEATDGSSHGSNGGLAGTAKGRRKRSHQCSPNRDVKAQKEVVFPATEIGQASNKSVDMIPSNAPGQKSKNLCTTLEIKDVKPTLSDILQPIPSEALIQNERELKRERRKQSNRESARRSRFRKQAETEELANKVQALISDNTNMKSEISTMMDRCKKLKLENAVLMGKLDNIRFRQTNDLRFEPTITRLKTTPPLATVDLLARVNNGDQENDDGEVYENRTSPVKLQPLLDGSH